MLSPPPLLAPPPPPAAGSAAGAAPADGCPLCRLPPPSPVAAATAAGRHPPCCRLPRRCLRPRRWRGPRPWPRMPPLAPPPALTASLAAFHRPGRWRRPHRWPPPPPAIAGSDPDSCAVGKSAGLRWPAAGGECWVERSAAFGRVSGGWSWWLVVGAAGGGRGRPRWTMLVIYPRISHRGAQIRVRRDVKRLSVKA